MDQTRIQLQQADVPLSDAPCRGCADPCDEGHDEYPKFDVDHETDMLGSIKPYTRQVVISTGKTDWVHDVAAAKGTLASYLDNPPSNDKDKDKTKEKEHEKDKNKSPNGVSVAGVFNSSKANRVSVINGSHRTVSDDHSKDTVLVFPDWKVFTEVEPSQAAANALFNHALSPSVPLHSPPPSNSDSPGSFKSWILPYASVILLCSHKRRDNRCAIAAPKLEHSLTLALEREGWEVHHQLEDPSLSGTALEDDPTLASESDQDKTRAEIRRRLQAIDAEHKRALILFCSHIGGHKYAGNVIINTSRGVSVWYGRVTPHEVDAIVKETIIGGRVLHPLLRGGMNLCQPGRASLNDW